MKNKQALGKGSKFMGEDRSFSPQMMSGGHIRPSGLWILLARNHFSASIS